MLALLSFFSLIIFEHVCNTMFFNVVDQLDIELYETDPEFLPTPKGTPYWAPDITEDEKPKRGDIFDTYKLAYDMYLE